MRTRAVLVTRAPSRGHRRRSVALVGRRPAPQQRTDRASARRRRWRPRRRTSPRRFGPARSSPRSARSSTATAPPTSGCTAPTAASRWSAATWSCTRRDRRLEGSSQTLPKGLSPGDHPGREPRGRRSRRGRSLHPGQSATLVVDATEASPRLAWRVMSGGTQADGTPSRLATYVDARTGPCCAPSSRSRPRTDPASRSTAARCRCSSPCPADVPAQGPDARQHLHDRHGQHLRQLALPLLGWGCKTGTLFTGPDNSFGSCDVVDGLPRRFLGRVRHWQQPVCLRVELPNGQRRPCAARPSGGRGRVDDVRDNQQPLALVRAERLHQAAGDFSGRGSAGETRVRNPPRAVGSARAERPEPVHVVDQVSRIDPEENGAGNPPALRLWFARVNFSF